MWVLSAMHTKTALEPITTTMSTPYVLPRFYPTKRTTRKSVEAGDRELIRGGTTLQKPERWPWMEEVCGKRASNHVLEDERGPLVNPHMAEEGADGRVAQATQHGQLSTA